METFTRDGLTFDVRDAGPADGPVVVCLHGFPQDARSFDAVVPGLVAAGFRVLAPDQRGYSPRARPPGRPAYVLRALVDDVEALLDAAGVGRAHVVGHDWGGAVGWAFASRRRERTASLTVLSTAHPEAMLRALTRSTQALRSAYVGGFQLPWLPERLLLARGGAVLRRALVRSGLPEHLATHDVDRMREPGALTAALGWYRAIPLGRAFTAGVVHVPTVLVTGERDPFFAPASVEGTRRLVRGPYEHRALPAGHWLPETRPDDVVRAVLAAARAADAEPGDGAAPGLAGWEGAGRWPVDDGPVREDAGPTIEPWANVDPGRPGPTL
ncbi:alpha/beta fold hydrolase [Cellulomonas cellasea]|uniref:Alpha/beta hydrolase n=2 Tax=Cellulomonas cellasea TaxID=43670 RepID=A0A4Y3KVG5_9CELL|nr:alpha/beta fold hydrolase [Cellulomonas cellasea]GEA88461.1 alpha/beta hydrolase [Cellulomonas cellasea]